jgi:LysM repeat protein
MVITLTKVMIRRAALEDLLSTVDHIEQGIDRAGLLVGELARDADGVMVRVFDTVELPGVPLRAEPPGLVIALADRLRQEAQATHPGRDIVGWFHTHKGSGVLASDEDAQVHLALSGLGAMVALIVDPLKQQASFFHPDGKTLIPFAGHYMFDMCNGDCLPTSRGIESVDTNHASSMPHVGLPELAEYTRSRPKQESRASRRPFGRWSNDVSLALRLASIALIVAMIALAAQVWVTQRALKRIAAGPGPAIEAGDNDDDPPMAVAPKTEPVETKPAEAAPTTAQPAPAKPAQKQVTIAAPAVPTVKPGAPGTVTVTVMPGESVALIARRLYGTATAERIGEVLEMNGIENPRTIRTGTVLVFPEPPPGSPGAAAVPSASPSASTSTSTSTSPAAGLDDEPGS